VLTLGLVAGTPLKHIHPHLPVPPLGDSYLPTLCFQAPASDPEML
jgi:hypothetical protein